MTRRTIFWTIAGITAVSAILSYRTNSDWDYPEDAGPAIDALIHGRIHDFLAARPLMGPFSLLLRAPFAALSLIHGDNYFYNDAYRFGVFPCLVVAGLFGLWLAKIAAERNQPRLVQFALVALCLVNPVTLRAVEVGHPEEVLGAALAAAAVVAGLRGRPWIATLLLAAAVATKQWAVLAIVPVALTLQPRDLRRAATVAAGVLAALLVPLLIADAGSLVSTTRHLADIRDSGMLPANVWWPFTAELSGNAETPAWLGVIAHPIVVGGGIAIALAYAGRVRQDPMRRALPLLALVLLFRCLFDPVDTSYYHVPFFMALVAADALSGTLTASLVATALLWLTPKVGTSADILNAFYLAWALPFAVYLAGRAYGTTWEDVRGAFRTRAARGRAAAP